MCNLPLHFILFFNMFRDLLTFSEAYHRKRSCQNTSLCIMVMQKEAYITLCRDVFRRHNATLLRHSEKNFILNYIVQFVITFFFQEVVWPIYAFWRHFFFFLEIWISSKCHEWDMQILFILPHHESLINKKQIQINIVM